MGMQQAVTVISHAVPGDDQYRHILLRWRTITGAYLGGLRLPPPPLKVKMKKNVLIFNAKKNYAKIRTPLKIYTCNAAPSRHFSDF